MKNGTPLDSILVTGGCGFIGSHLVRLLLETTSAQVINLDAMTYAAQPHNLVDVADHERYTFIEGNILNADLLQQLFRQNNIQQVYHLAAESHVDNSIAGPRVFIDTNVTGTFTLLEAARQAWITFDHQIKPEYDEARFIHVSTDEVYGSLGDTGLFREGMPYAPNSPYSASKASSDLIARSYHKTYNLPVIITHCSNNYGPGQHDEKLIPVVIRKALAGEPIPVYGTGSNVRDWLYVRDHALALQLVADMGAEGETYNIGGDNEHNNLDLVTRICGILDREVPREGSFTEQITFVTDRPGHDQRYAIDASKIKTALQWKPTETFESGLMKTVRHYLDLYQV